ncbi:MAG: xanthine dehydrogenase family protein subunit M [Anaerolineales bacterium]|nr:xanthine dehydrogenase family protein subunit M [Anaerolineales bacterium]
MKAFELYDATTVEEAVGLLEQHGPTSKVVAGGSDLVTGVMKDWIQGPGMPYPNVLIDITTIPALHGITATDSGLTIGAATTLTDVIQNETVRQTYPLLADAAASVASPLIRNFATLGGNVNQRPRCWFLRGENFPCYKKGGDFCFAVTGDNTYHAIIGGELCYIVHPSDTATALLALNASATVASAGGQRVVPFDEYFIGPREDVLRENILQANEMMVDVQVPAPAANTRMAWTKLKDRQVYDFALTSVAVSAVVDNGVWTDGRVVLGGVSPVPWRAAVVEQALVGKDIASAARSAAALIRNEARPLSNNAYKVDIAVGLTERTILSLLA